MKTKNNLIGGNAKVVRSVNRATILNLIRTRQPISRATIAKLIGLNKSTVSSIVNDLINEDLIIEEERPDQNVGRNPIQLRLKPGRFFVGAVNLDSNISRVAVVDINGQLVAKKSLPGGNSVPPEQLIRQSSLLLKKMQKDLSLKTLHGIGFSIAGIVDRMREIVNIAPNLHWLNIPVGEIIRKEFPRQQNIFFENDAKASALAELWFGKGKIENINDFVFLSVGAGIGSGIVVGKKLLDGFNHSAGEFGHTILFENGALCNCGNRGCLEVYASDRATVKRYKALTKNAAQNKKDKEIFIEDVVARSGAGDIRAQKTIKQTGHYLGLGISNIIKAIDPQAIVIGGKIALAWDILYPEIRETVSGHDLYRLGRHIEILPSSLSERPRLLGAATLPIREMFSDYQIVL